MKVNNIATIEEIASFWTEILRSEDSDLKDKLKVSELLIKALGGILEVPKDISLKELSPSECMEILKEVNITS